MMRFLECGVLLRIYTVLMSGLYSYTALNESDTLVWQVAHANEFSWFVMVGLGVLAFLAFVDLVVNDLMPERFTILRALHDRHLVTMGIAGCFAVQMWTCVQYGYSTAVLPYYGVYALMVPAAAFTDVRKRYKNAPCQ